MEKVNLLIGKWEIVGAQKYINSAWQQSDSFVSGMIWDFHPQYFSPTRVIGNITETSPEGFPAQLNYIYTIDESILKIEVFVDTDSGALDDSAADIYKVYPMEGSSQDKPTIFIDILNQENHPYPYLRYTLQQIDL